MSKASKASAIAEFRADTHPAFEDLVARNEAARSELDALPATPETEMRRRMLDCIAGKINIIKRERE